MNEKTLTLLEFDTIRQRVAERSLSEEAALVIRNDVPLCNAEKVHELKSLVEELCNCISSALDEPRSSIPSVAFLFPKLDVEGTSLEIDEAFALGLFVLQAEALTSWLMRCKVDITSNKDKVSANKFDTLSIYQLIQDLPNCSAVSKEVFRVLNKDGSLKDLPEFREIKRRIQNLNADLERTASRYTGSEEMRRMLQSALPSQRDGRTVLAVKANFRGRIKGIVHEVSATGQTVFIEPEDVVEKNNEILIEQRNLDAEILKVLRNMTSLIAEHRFSLRELHEKIIYIETLRARARYSIETRGTFAKAFTQESASHKGMKLLQARHPLLGTNAVPINFEMNTGTMTVIITGPNTGGKTVTLKTAGLFAMMNQFALALPAEEGTRLPIFDSVYADIGDEQSIKQSLSTFSAHMTNIASITENATEHSLVLLDELGSGTDPEEGSAIAMAILDYLIEKKSMLIITTHHGILKNYGYTRSGVENASVEFDGKTLSPTYKIIMGIPGESRAVDIAGRNGLKKEIIEKARSYIDEERSDISALITGLKQKHRELDAADELQKSEKVKLREERRKADLKTLQLKQKELELKSSNVGSLHRLLGESRKTLENLVREIKEGEITREKTLAVKQFLSNLEKSAAAEDELLAKESAELAQERSSVYATLDDASLGDALPNIAKGIIEVGAEVLAGEFKRRGTILRAAKKGHWIVEIGSLKMTMNEKDLILLEPSKPKELKPIVSHDVSSSVDAKYELSIRGMRMDEALDALQRQIDAAVLSGLYEFSVVHGKGDGILQKGVHDFLKKQSVVQDYFFSRPELGGFGRTEVVLKR
jgi:DNA mismatch repair protein MutS2